MAQGTLLRIKSSDGGLRVLLFGSVNISGIIMILHKTHWNEPCNKSVSVIKFRYDME